MTLLSMFAHDVDFSNEKYQDFNLILMHISVLINDYEELDEIDKMALKKMIVFLGLNIGAPISYLSVFEDMRRSRELYISYNKLKRLGVIAPKKLMHTYRVLTIKLGRYPSLLKDIIINKNKFTADEMYLNNNYKLEDMRVDLSNENTKIYYNKLAAKILSCEGVIDYTNLTVNGSSSNIITIPTDNVAVIDEINITTNVGVANE
jgi:hypothetical protein